MPRPNIIYMHSHDTGRWVSPYGHAVRTPALQRFAAQGVLFRQAFCAAPTCSPSRAALLTGQCAHSSGMLGLAHRGFALRDGHQHIVHTLRTAGYDATLCGVQHVARNADQIGYDRVLDSRSMSAAHVGPAAARFLLDKPGEPFFASVGFFQTHRPFPEPQDDPRYAQVVPPLPDAPQTRRDVSGFKTAVHALDRGIGTVLEALDEAGLADRTLVILTTDHGPAFPAMKCNLTDHGIGVMLLMRGPGGFTGGKVIDALVSQVDLFPTICELTGIDAPPWLQGGSFGPLVRGQSDSIREEVFAEVNFHAAPEPMRAIRTARHKFIRRYDGTRVVGPNCDDGPSKRLWLDTGWRDRPVETEQLYDVVLDPNETHNLVDRDSHAGVLADLTSRLERWMLQTDDPLLAGSLPLPSGARLNRADQLSPDEPAG